jgi:hypothetical protein
MVGCRLNLGVANPAQRRRWLGQPRRAGCLGSGRPCHARGCAAAEEQAAVMLVARLLASSAGWALWCQQAHLQSPQLLWQAVRPQDFLPARTVRLLLPAAAAAPQFQHPCWRWVSCHPLHHSWPQSRSRLNRLSDCQPLLNPSVLQLLQRLLRYPTQGLCQAQPKQLGMTDCLAAVLPHQLWRALPILHTVGCWQQGAARLRSQSCHWLATLLMLAQQPLQQPCLPQRCDRSPTKLNSWTEKALTKPGPGRLLTAAPPPHVEAAPCQTAQLLSTAVLHGS